MDEQSAAEEDEKKLSCGDVCDCLDLFCDVIDRVTVDAAEQMSQQCHNVFILSTAQKRNRGAKPKLP